MRSVLLLLLIFLSGCSYFSHIKRAERKLDRAVVLIGPMPSIGYIATKYGGLDTQTVIKHDTVQRTVSDTFYLPGRDTVIQVENNRVRLQLHKVRDTVYVKATCLDSLVYVEKIASLRKAIDAYEKMLKHEENIKKITELNSTLRWIFIALIVGLLLLAALLVLRFVSNISKFFVP